MRIDCQTYGHWKDLLICAMSCPYTSRCKQFKQWKEDEENKSALWERVMNYITRHPQHPYELILTPTANHKRSTKDNAMKRFVCIQEDEISLLNEEEITKQLLQGTMFEEIFELGRAMELQIRLIPAKKTKDKEETKEETKEAAKEEVKSDNGVSKSRGKRSKKSSQVDAVQ